MAERFTRNRMNLIGQNLNRWAATKGKGTIWIEKASGNNGWLIKQSSGPGETELFHGKTWAEIEAFVLGFHTLFRIQFYSDHVERPDEKTTDKPKEG